MHWTVKIKGENDEYAWFTYAESEVIPECEAYGLQHRKRAAPKFVETSIGPVCYEYEHVDRVAVVEPVLTNQVFNNLKRKKMSQVKQTPVGVQLYKAAVIIIAAIAIYYGIKGLML